MRRFRFFRSRSGVRGGFAVTQTSPSRWLPAVVLLVAIGAAPLRAAAPAPPSVDPVPLAIASCPDQGTWHRLPDAAVAREDHAAAYDSKRDRMIVFGGSDGSDSLYTSQTWVLGLSGEPWRRLGIRGNAVPRPREGHTAIYDTRHDRIIVFGGLNEDNITQYRNDVWSLSMRDSTWTQLRGDSCFGNGFVRPECRWYHSAIYDSLGDRMIVYGGSYRTTMTSDVWAYALDGTNRWTLLIEKGRGPEATSHTAVWDPKTRSMYVFGGYNAQIGPASNQVWALRLDGTPRWERLLPAGELPAPRYDHVAVWDAPRQRMVVYGGWGLPPASTVYDDVWELTLAGSPRWTKLSPGGELPEPRRDATGVFDAGNERMLVYGGEGADEEIAETWSLDFRDRVAPAAAGDLAVSTRSRTGVSLTWTAPGDDDTTGTACAYDLRYSTQPFETNHFDHANRVVVAAPAPAGSPEVAWVDGLQPCTAYSFVLQTEDDAGNRSAFSPVVSATTNCAPGERARLPEESASDSLSAATGAGAAAARVSFEIGESQAGAPYTATVLDVSGRRVREVARGVAPRGRLELAWDGRDQNGTAVGRGLYFLRLRLGELARTWKVLVLR